MSGFVDTMNNEYFSGEEYDNWEEYLSDDDISVAPVSTPIPPPLKKETEEEKQARILKHLADIAAVTERLNWIGEKKLEQERELDNKEFPVLGTKAPTKDKSLKTPRMSTNIRKMVITGKSYAEKFREKQKQKNEIVKDNKRTEAFSLLADREVLEKKLEKTRMCNSIDKKEKCPHGERCRFAHSLDELNISKCFFGDECRFVKNVGGRVVNSDRKVCPHRHPNETTDEFYFRTNLCRFKKEEPKILDLTRVVEHRVKKENEFNNDREQGINWSSKVKVVTPVVDSSKTDTILRVPRELAIQAMELAIKSGNTSVCVEII